MNTIILSGLLACTAASPLVSDTPSTPESGDTSGEAADALPGWRGDFGSPLVPLESVPGWDSPVFSDTSVMHIDLTLSEASYAALETDPTTYVEGSVTVGARTWSPVGVRLKGTASFQPIDAKANFKLKFEDYSEGRFFGLDRLTLQNNYWDPSMMAQVLAYRFFADAGVPSPRTGYAWVTLNGVDKGLYTMLESMDSQLVDRLWPDSEGNLYETTADCDFDGDGSCFELQEQGDGEPDPDAALDSALAAVDAGTQDALRAAFDWENLIAFLAAERVLNHADSYSYNLNNYFAYHDPVTDRVSLLPWGCDSTFNNGYREVLAGESEGWLGRFCESDAACEDELHTALPLTADLLASTDLAGYAEQRRELIRPYVEADPLAVYTPEHFEAWTDALIVWIDERPAEIDGFLRLWE